jgi:hypothetical protein
MVPKKESLMIKIYNIVTVCFFKNAINCISYRLRNIFFRRLFCFTAINENRAENMKPALMTKLFLLFHRI